MKVNESIKKFLDSAKDNGVWKDMNTFLEARKDSETLPPDVWVRKWGEYCLNNDELAVPFYKAKLDNVIKPLPERLRSAFGKQGFKVNENLMKKVYSEDFTDVPYEEFTGTLGKMKQYYDEYEAQKQAIKDRRDRQEEIKNWGLLDIITSDYAKQRYLEEPQTSLFGKQAPDIGEAPNTRWGASADLAAGAAGFAADLVPYGKAFLIGPAIRAGRDLAYLPSDYSKDIMSLGRGIVSDFALNGGAKYLANMRKGARIAAKSTSPEVARTFNVENTTDAINKGLSELNSVKLAGKSNREIINIIDDLPESPLKEELQAITAEAKGSIMLPLDKTRIGETIAKFQKETSEPIQQLARKTAEGNVNIVANPEGPAGPLANPSKYLTEVSLSKPASELTKGERISLLKNRAAASGNSGGPGQVLVQGSADLRGRGMGTVSYNNEDEFERRKAEAKKNFGESWLKFPTFRPKEVSSDPYWEAYKELMEEHGIRIGE